MLWRKLFLSMCISNNPKWTSDNSACQMLISLPLSPLSFFLMFYVFFLYSSQYPSSFFPLHFLLQYYYFAWWMAFYMDKVFGSFRDLPLSVFVLVIPDRKTHPRSHHWRQESQRLPRSKMGAECRRVDGGQAHWVAETDHRQSAFPKRNLGSHVRLLDKLWVNMMMIPDIPRINTINKWQSLVSLPKMIISSRNNTMKNTKR